MNTIIPLPGCAPIPLAHYLKALGVFRLVSEQRDSGTTCSWRGDIFEIESTLNREELTRFFLYDYQPTPVIAPWNGGSGFFQKDNRVAITAIERSEAARLKSYRLSIGLAQNILRSLGLKDKPEKDTKEILLQQCRNGLDEQALAWCDAAFVLGQDGAKYPPLLGTGGNDGRLEFTNNFMQRLCETFDPATGLPTPAAGDWLRQALFGENVQTVVSKAPVGQFYPGAAGGANSTAGFDGASFVNPWDYLLMLEGTLLFAAASVKKLESVGPGALVYPFCVRQAGVGYGSASLADETASRSEMWMPLWNRHIALAELSALFSEGRAQVGGRPARNGVDFARAVVTRGVDQGIGAFQRYAFQLRNGLAYFAVPLNRIIVRRNANADLLSDLDKYGWLERFRSRAKADDAPASATSTVVELDSCIFDLCENKEDPLRIQKVLIALGRCEAAMARSFKWTQPPPPSPALRPVPLLRSEWLAATTAQGSTVEFRLAAALASIGGYYGNVWLPLRCHLEPVESSGSPDRPFFKWADNPGNNVISHEGDLIRAMNAVFTRRLILAEQAGEDRNLPDSSRVPVSLDDVAAFIARETDDELLVNLMRGLSLVNWAEVKPGYKFAVSHNDKIFVPSTDTAVAPSSLYALLKLCFQRPPRDEQPIPLVPSIHRRAVQGDGLEASRSAARRLRASGFPPAVEEVAVQGPTVCRTAAALLFPLTPWQVGRLRLAVLRLERETDITRSKVEPSAATSNLA